MTAYFIFMAVLFVVYVAMRLAIGWQLKIGELWPKRAPRWDSNEPGAGIDASKLTGRLEQLRQGGHAEAAGKPASFKKPLMVEEKRLQMEKMAFFQKPPPSPPPPETPEHEEGMTLLLI